MKNFFEIFDDLYHRNTAKAVNKFASAEYKKMKIQYRAARIAMANRRTQHVK